MRRPQAATLAGRLARALILWVSVTWCVCVLGVALYVDRAIDLNFDRELVRASHRMFDIAERLLDADSPGTRHGLAPDAPLIAPAPLFAQDEVPYQVVAHNGQVLLRSAKAQPAMFHVPLAPGFAETDDDVGVFDEAVWTSASGADSWRVYTLAHPQRPLYLQVADPEDARIAAVRRTVLVLIAAMLAVLPLLAFGLRRIARRELGAIDRLSRQMAQRGGEDLSALNLAGLPDELRAMGEDANQLLLRLQQALQVERALAANAAHELRTPLATARLRLQAALASEVPRAEVQAALHALQTLSQRTEKLLQLSRAESGAALTRAPVDLVQLAATVAQEFWQDPATAARLDLQVPSQPIAPVLADVDALAIALRNLVENALRYAGAAPVVLRVAAPASLIVTDDGPGVPADRLGTLRQRHVRHSADKAGYGLGLSIVSTITRQHGGMLHLLSPAPGRGGGFEARMDL